MKIENVIVKSEGYVNCKSNFYSVNGSLGKYSCCSLHSGLNILNGEIDSGNWAVSYLLSMYKHSSKDFVLSQLPNVTVNGQEILLNDFLKLSCYMDQVYPLFSSNKSIKKIVSKHLLINKIDCSCNDIRELFEIDSERFSRPLKGVGNERFRAMAAIGFACGKDVFCFPWLSNYRFQYYHGNLTSLFEILERLNKTIVFPIGFSTPE